VGIERSAAHALELFAGETELSENLLVRNALATVEGGTGGGVFAGFFLGDRLIVEGSVGEAAGSSMASSRPTTAETCLGTRRSISSWACSLVSAIIFLPFSHSATKTAHLSCAVAINLSIVVKKARCS
jgi:hypothetical protein